MTLLLSLYLFAFFGHSNVVAIASKGCVSLTTIPAQSIDNLWNAEISINRWAEQTTMKMADGKTYSNYIVIHPLERDPGKGSATWALNGEYSRFSAIIGLAGTTNLNCGGYKDGKGKTQWFIYLDDVLKFTSQVFDDANALQSVDLDVTGRSSIRFEIDSFRHQECDHATLAAPILCDAPIIKLVAVDSNGKNLQTNGLLDLPDREHVKIQLGQYDVLPHSDPICYRHSSGDTICKYSSLRWTHCGDYSVSSCVDDDDGFGYILDCTRQRWWNNNDQRDYTNGVQCTDEAKDEWFDNRGHIRYSLRQLEVRPVYSSGFVSKKTNALPEDDAGLSVLQVVLLIGAVVFIVALLIGATLMFVHCRKADMVKKMSELKDEEVEEEEESQEAEQEEITDQTSV